MKRQQRTERRQRYAVHLEDSWLELLMVYMDSPQGSGGSMEMDTVRGKRYKEEIKSWGGEQS